MFAHGRSKNAPTDKQYLNRRKQRLTPTDFLKICRGRSILFDKLEFVNLTPYDSACDFCLTHNGYGRVNALLYENELSHRAYV